MTGQLSNYRFLAIIIWLLAVALSLAWNTVDNIREQNETAQETARAFFEQIIAARRWNLLQGGIYVYTTKDSPPNEFLPKDKQFIRDNNGRKLSLITPSDMTRQIAATNREKGQIRFHITSLTPLRPENKPYLWEVNWLESFALGSTEKSGFAEEDGKKVFRYMAPLAHSTSCNPCHTAEKEAHGNIQGAISISLPIRFHKSSWPLILSHLFIALTGITGIFFFGGHLARRRKNILNTNRQLEQEIEERKQTEDELITIQENLGEIVDSRTTELHSINDILDSKIKEQQRIEESLVSITHEFIQIFDSAPDGMHLIDLDFNIIRVNRAYRQLAGMSTEEILGKKCYEIFSGKLCQTEQCPLTRILEGAKRVEIESRKTRPDGTIIPCIVTATPFRKPDGKLTGIIEVTRDISNWKKIEHSLSTTAEHLRARNVELEDFTHVISHDLQEPLLLIKAFSERIRTKCAQDLPEKGRTYLQRIESSTNRMQNLINGLLLYSRVSSKAKPFEPVDLQSIIHSVLDDLTIKIEKYQANIDIDKTIPTIEADPLQMRQLFQNIIGNSLKYHHPDRSLKITITCIVLPEQSDRQKYIRFCIEDNGIGFKKEYQKLIFDIFQRLHTRQQAQGTGIGLSICKKIVDRHLGTITAEGIPDQGAKFTITLPLRQKRLHETDDGSNNLVDVVMNRR
ncbi:MAG: ATP-binding protein [Thermodesulfobacteriota bacterium]|nr:ATP-binding protein [Thermodesulfobacteriota bacterium]